MRKPFMDHLCMFYHEKGQPLTAMPTIGKNNLDLWKLYMAVKERGGCQQVGDIIKMDMIWSTDYLPAIIMLC